MRHLAGLALWKAGTGGKTFHCSIRSPAEGCHRYCVPVEEPVDWEHGRAAGAETGATASGLRRGSSGAWLSRPWLTLRKPEPATGGDGWTLGRGVPGQDSSGDGAGSVSEI